MSDENKDEDVESKKQESEDPNKPWGMLIPNCDESLQHQSLTEKEFTLGRSNRCTMRISNPHISGVHFKITLQEVKNITLVSIVDHSSNGTFINQVRVISSLKKENLLLNNNYTLVRKRKTIFIKTYEYNLISSSQIQKMEFFLY